MKNGIKIVAVLSMAIASMFGTTAMVNHVAATTPTQQIGCGKSGCDGKCRLGCRRAKCNACNSECGYVECPQCACQTCYLEVDQSKVKKTCFKVEQKVICIPPIRFPWQDCPPTTARTRTVNVLKTHSYECPSCSYKWTLPKCEVVETPVMAGDAIEPPAGQATVIPSPVVPQSTQTLKADTQQVTPAVKGQWIPLGDSK